MIVEIRKHRLQNGNVMLGLADLMNNTPAKVFYSDPPWGNGNLKYWQTINKRHNDVERNDVDLIDFLKQIFSLAKSYTKEDGVIFIEYGIQWKQEIIDFGTSIGLHHLGVAEIKYKSGSKWLPHHLHIFSKQKLILPENYLQDLKGTTGVNCLIMAVSPFVKDNDIILDPCCGLGMTARLAVKLNLQFRGNELNAKRLKVTENWLIKNTK
jgi:hypothetical protein